MIFFFWGCSNPLPEAPENVESIVGYIFEHFDDEEEQYLQSGIKNLREWSYSGENLDQSQDGYSVDDIQDSLVSSLDGTNREILYELIGVGLNYDLDSTPVEIAEALFMEDWGAISGDTYEQYQRDFSEDPECLITDKCQWLEYDLYTEAQWLSGLIKTEMNSHGEIRWVESEGEMVLIQRWWMVGPLEVSPDLGLDFNGQYYLHISIPDGIGMIRSQTLWFDVDYGDFIFDEDWGRNQIIDTMKKENQILDDWLSEQL